MTAPPVPSEWALKRDDNLCAICGHWCGRKCEHPLEWNPRFLAYCALAHGDATPEVVLERIKTTHPGGRLTAFVVWLRATIGEWQTETLHWNDPLDHDAFDAWLRHKVLDARIARNFIETGRGTP
jgi:hypothetical protein